VVDKVAQGQFVSEYFDFPPSVSFCQGSILICILMCRYQKDKRSKPGNLQKSNALLDTTEHWTQKYCPWMDAWMDEWAE
jgi:hypothetical protein